MDLKNMSDEILKKKIKQSESILKKAEGEFVGALNAVSILEAEKERRDLKKKTSTPPKRVTDLVKRWTAKAGEMLKAAESTGNDQRTKKSIMQQRDILLNCTLELEDAWKD